VLLKSTSLVVFDEAESALLLCATVSCAMRAMLLWPLM
jgi:hypothetical protein